MEIVVALCLNGDGNMSCWNPRRDTNSKGLIKECKEKFKINVEVDESRLVMLDGYSAEGYKNIDRKKVKVIKQFAGQTGIILDPAYTGKTFYAYHENFLKNKKRSNILFLHTGGIFGVFAKRKAYLS